jgi:hypothetical protein
MALTGMFFGYVIFFVSVMPGPRLALPIGILLFGCAAYIGSRPEPAHRRARRSRTDTATIAGKQTP